MIVLFSDRTLGRVICSDKDSGTEEKETHLRKHQLLFNQSKKNDFLIKMFEMSKM
jgi:hypothetical protein